MNFLENISNWNNHRPLLWLALENTKGDVLEIGMGDGSTPYLNDYCKRTGRSLYSYESNDLYFDKYKYLQSSFHKIDIIRDWNLFHFLKEPLGVALIDHAPPERRHIDAIALKDNAEIVIVHDAEHEGMYCDVYYIKRITDNFKYRLDLTIPGQPAKSIMLSNKIDVSKFTIPNFTL